MNTAFITRAAGKSLSRHKASIASGSLAAVLVTSAMSLAEKYMDQNAATREIDAVEQRINKRIDDLKADQVAKDQAQWKAIERKADRP